MKIFIISILIFSSSILKPQVNQEWLSVHNGPANLTDEALIHITDSSGNVYAAGKIYGMDTGFDIYAVKLNPSGNIIWQHTFNGPGNGNDAAYSLAVDNSLNLYLTGESKGDGTDRDFILIKYNSSGSILWNKRFNGKSNSFDVAVKVSVDASGNPVVSGYSYENNSSFDLVTIKYDPDGNQLWIRKYNGPGNGSDIADDMLIDNSGNVCVSGSSLGQGTINDFVLIKYNSSGTEQWVRRYNGPVNGNDNFTSLASDTNANLFITGSSIGSGTSLDFATIKYSPAGEELWLRRYTGPANSSPDEPKAIVCDNAGNVIITGSSVGVSTSYDFLTVKYSSSGNEEWSTRFTGLLPFGFDEPRSLTVDISGNAYVAGLSSNASLMDDIILIKYSPEGNQLWMNRFNSPSNGNDVANTVSLDLYGNLFISGFTTGITSGSDFTLIKYSQLTSSPISSNEIPGKHELTRIYPNPFNPSAKISYRIKSTGLTEISVYNSEGRFIKTLVRELKAPGIYETYFHAHGLQSGVYLFTLRVNNEFINSGKCLLIK